MTVSDQIIEVLNALCEKFGIVLDWGNENVVPYVMTLGEKLVNFEIWTSVVALVAGIIAAIIFIMLVSKPSVREFIWEEDVNGALAAIGLFCLGMFATAMITIETFDIIKCITFPELYIFEYIQTLINSVS